MEKNLFDWSAWDLLGDTLLQFYGCKLKVPIGEFKVGDTVPIILVDFEHGTIQLLEKGRAEGRCGTGGSSLISEHKVRMVLTN